MTIFDRHIYCSDLLGILVSKIRVMVTNVGFFLLASLSMVMVAGAFQSLPMQFVLLGCKGNNNMRNLARLSRVCEDCYALYKDQGIPVTCRENCFNNPVFDQCVRSIVKEHLIEDLLVLAQEIGQKSVESE